MRININRFTISAVIFYYIASYLMCLWLLRDITESSSVAMNSILLYYFIAVFYLPLNVFIMFLFDTPVSLTIPGLISMVICGHIFLGHIDFTVNV